MYMKESAIFSLLELPYVQAKRKDAVFTDVIKDIDKTCQVVMTYNQPNRDRYGFGSRFSGDLLNPHGKPQAVQITVMNFDEQRIDKVIRLFTWFFRENQCLIFAKFFEKSMQDTERKKLFATAFLNPDMSVGNPLRFFNQLLSRKRFGQTSLNELDKLMIAKYQQHLQEVTAPAPA